MNELELLLNLQECKMLINDIENILNTHTASTAKTKVLRLIEKYRNGGYCDV